MMNARELSEDLDRAEVYRYLGCVLGRVPEETVAAVERLLPELTAQATPRYACAEFALEREPEGIRLAGSALVLPGEDIAALLTGCDACLLMAATLGAAADRAIDAAQRRSITDGLVLDAIANTLIEACCDKLQEGRPTTMRYSPGYGDLPLALQPKLLAVLDAPRRIGLHCTGSHLLTPRKSVTAVMGLIGATGAIGAAGATGAADVTGAIDACARCASAGNCSLRKAGKRCGR